MPAVISPYILAAIGERAARRYFLTAEPFDAVQAHQLGLVHDIIPREQLCSHAHELAERLMAHAPAAVAATKQLITDIANRPIDADVIEKTVECIAQVRTSDEAKEGLKAFFEKRSPNWAQKDHA